MSYSWLYICFPLSRWLLHIAGPYIWSYLLRWLRPYCGSIHMIPSIRMVASISRIHVSLDAYSCITRHVYQRCQICICICLICRSPDGVVLVLALACKASQPSPIVLPSCFRQHLLHSILSHLLFTSYSISLPIPYPEVPKCWQLWSISIMIHK